MSNRTYDTLRIFAQLILPLGTLISGLMTIWELPYAEQLMASFSALDVFAGAIVTIAKAQWDKEHADGRG